MQGTVNGAVICVIAALLFSLCGCDSAGGGKKVGGVSSKWTAAHKGNPSEKGRRAEETRELVHKAHDELASGNLSPAFETASAAVATDPNDPYAIFVYAEALAANGDVFGSLRALERSLIKGFADKKMIYQSRHLSVIRKSTGFKELMAKYGMTQGTR